MQNMEFQLPKLPISIDVETKQVLKKLATAHRCLAELKGISGTIPNQIILLNTLSLQEAKDSSAIENIITSHDELFKADADPLFVDNLAAKEVKNYVFALHIGYDLITQNKLLTSKHLISIQQQLENNNAGFRKLPGTVLKNLQTGETIYTPPQDPQVVQDLMKNLEEFLNNDEASSLDPLLKMAIAHYQFESIHPFYDGNGRTGRIMCVLYLVLKGLLDIPVLYLSRYIVRNKSDYYRLLQQVRDKESWEEWLLYMLSAVEETSTITIKIINEIKALLLQYKHRIRSEHKKIYSQDLINAIFSHPYTKIEFLERALKISRLTATKYLDILATSGFLTKQKVGRVSFYINVPLCEILSREA